MGHPLNMNTNTSTTQSQLTFSSFGLAEYKLPLSQQDSIAAPGGGDHSDTRSVPKPTSRIHKLTKHQTAARNSKKALQFEPRESPRESPRLNRIVKGGTQHREVISAPARRAKARAVKKLAAQRLVSEQKNIVDYCDLQATLNHVRGAADVGNKADFVGIGSASNTDDVPRPRPLLPIVSSRLESSRFVTGERIVLALLAPLPNEHKFALNVCLIMSLATKEFTDRTDNENAPSSGSAPSSSLPKPNSSNFDVQLQFKECPGILDALLGHLGVFHDCGTRELFVDIGSAQELNHAMVWMDILKRAPEAVRRLQCEFYNRQPLVHQIIGHASKKPVCCHLCVICSSQTETEVGLGSGDEEEYDLFTTPPQTTKGVEWFIEVSSILKGACFSESNARLMASHRALKRFLLLAIHSNSVKLAEVATIILSHTAPFMKLSPPDHDPMTAMLMNYVKAGLWSEDRFQILYSMEILTGLLAHNDARSLCWESVGSNIATRILEILLLNDVHLLLTTFTCLQEMTRRLVCSFEQFAACTGFIKTLIRFLSYEARAGETKPFGIRMTVDKEVPEPAELAAGNFSPEREPSSSSFTSNANPLTAQPACPPTTMILIPPRSRQFQTNQTGGMAGEGEVKKPVLVNAILNSVTPKGRVYSCPDAKDGESVFFIWKYEPFEGFGRTVTYFDDMTQPLEMRLPYRDASGLFPAIPAYYTVWARNPALALLTNNCRDQWGYIIPFLEALSEPGVPECGVRRPHYASGQPPAKPQPQARLQWTSWIRMTAAYVLKALALNSWRARESLRANHYSSLVELQNVTRELGAEYQDGIDDLVEVLEKEDKAFYHHPTT